MREDYTHSVEDAYGDRYEDYTYSVPDNCREKDDDYKEKDDGYREKDDGHSVEDAYGNRYEDYHCMRDDSGMVDQDEQQGSGSYNQEFSAFYADPSNMYEMVPLENDDFAESYGDTDDETGQGT